ncbi:MAG: hypothetical protein H7Z11_20330 [Verrucomicrobia bacterium]|nr:hypothetical protein [Leptolyngbya sp. ES-bin-22]
MKITKLSPDTQAILGKMCDRRARLDALMDEFSTTDLAQTQKLAKIQTEVRQILSKSAA